MSSLKQGKVVLITGSSSGIGYALALTFAKAGFQTIATMRNPDKAAELLEAAAKQDLSLDIRQLDVCDDQSVAVCINAVLKDYGRIDVLINNAGEGFHCTLEQASMDEIKKVMDVNFYSVARVTKAVLPSMREAKQGHIITVSSLGGLIAVPFSEIYCAAKFAVEGMMEGLALIANTFGVHVSLIEPGLVATAFAGKLQKKNEPAIADYDERDQNLRANFPKYFPAGPQTKEEVAKVILAAVLSENPRLRYVTSADGERVASLKYVDLTDNSYHNLGKKLFAAEETIA